MPVKVIVIDDEGNETVCEGRGAMIIVNDEAQERTQFTMDGVMRGMNFVHAIEQMEGALPGAVAYYLAHSKHARAKRSADVICEI